MRQAPSGGGVLVSLAFNSVNYPTGVPLPTETSKDWNINNLIAQAGSVDVGWLKQAWIDIQSDVRIYSYEAPTMPAHTGENVVPFTALSHLPVSTVVTDNRQPFPIYGWLMLKWFDTQLVGCIEQG